MLSFARFRLAEGKTLACIADINAAHINMEHHGLGVLRVFKMSVADIKDKWIDNSDKLMRKVMEQIKERHRV